MTRRVFGMCYALMDVQVQVDDDVVEALGIAKGAMNLVSAAEQEAILARIAGIDQARAAGGSGANTMQGLALMGTPASFTSRVGPDPYGEAYHRSLAEGGVRAHLPIGPTPTGACIVLVTPDAQRTMCTFLGAGSDLGPSDIDTAEIAECAALYVTGYLWDRPNQKAAVRAAMASARSAGVQVAFSLSDPFVVDRHLDEFRALIAADVDVVLGNAAEACALTGAADPYEAAAALAASTSLTAVTLGAEGAVVANAGRVLHKPASPVVAVDTTGAGDAYAAGLLHGVASGWDVDRAAELASAAASCVVGRYGPRLVPADVSRLPLVA